MRVQKRIIVKFLHIVMHV